TAAGLGAGLLVTGPTHRCGRRTEWPHDPGPAGASRTASCSTAAKEWLAAPPAPLGYPNLKPTTTPAQPTTPASKSCVDHETASTPFVLALRAPGAAC